jgi:hypothetical protein
MGSLLVPLGVPLRRVAVAAPARRSERVLEPGGGEPALAEPEPPREDLAAEIAELGAEDEPLPAGEPDTAPLPLLLPFARRDLERLRLVLLAQRRLREAHGPGSARRLIVAKSYFDDAVRWLEIHGGPDGRELGAEWRELAASPAGPLEEGDPATPDRPAAAGAPAEGDGKSRRRRRRRRRRPRSEPVPPA